MPSPASLWVTMAYGVFALVGFLRQVVVRMQGCLCRSSRGIGQPNTPGAAAWCLLAATLLDFASAFRIVRRVVNA